jgi:hypothetical protein
MLGLRSDQMARDEFRGGKTWTRLALGVNLAQKKQAASYSGLLGLTVELQTN